MNIQYHIGNIIKINKIIYAMFSKIIYLEYYIPYFNKKK